MEQRALVIINGQVQQLPSGDTLAGVSGVSTWKEPTVSVGATSELMFSAITGDIMMSSAG